MSPSFRPAVTGPGPMPSAPSTSLGRRPCWPRAGRLIRSATDRGVVAVLDPRLATSASYRWDLVRGLPPMRRTRDRAEAEAFLREITAS